MAPKPKVFDPATLTGAQLSGYACVVCSTSHTGDVEFVPVGSAAGGQVFACDICASDPCTSCGCCSHDICNIGLCRESCPCWESEQLGAEPANVGPTAPTERPARPEEQTPPVAVATTGMWPHGEPQSVRDAADADADARFWHLVELFWELVQMKCMDTSHRHGEYGGWLLVELVTAVVDGRIPAANAMALGRALARGELERIERATGR